MGAFAARHRVLLKSAYPVLQIGTQNFLDVTGQKSMNLDAQSLEVDLPLARKSPTQQYLRFLGEKLVAFLVDAQAARLANRWLTVRVAETDQHERFGRLEERGNSLAAKWDGDFHDRGNGCDSVIYANDVPGSAKKVI